MNVYRKRSRIKLTYNLSMKTRKGFTLIELLVVIAVIGILAGIVLVSVRKTPDLAKDAAIQAAMDQVRTEAQTIYTETNGFTTLCDTGELNIASSTILASINESIGTNGGDASCFASADHYCVYTTLKTKNDDDSNKYFCIDDTGVPKVYTTTPDCAADNFTCATDV